MEEPKEQQQDRFSTAETEPFLEEASTITAQKQRSPLLWTICQHLTTIILTSAIWWFVTSNFQTRTLIPGAPRRQTVTLNCGSTVAEARSLNCQYDVLSNLWVPKPCLDFESIENFKELAPNDWRGYPTPDGGELLTVDQMSELNGENAYYTSAREHLVHCALMWQRLHRGYLHGTKILDINTISWTHTKHCSEMLIMFGETDPRHLKELVTRTTAGFSSCEMEI